MEAWLTFIILSNVNESIIIELQQYLYLIKTLKMKRHYYLGISHTLKGHTVHTLPAWFGIDVHVSV